MLLFIAALLGVICATLIYTRHTLEMVNTASIDDSTRLARARGHIVKVTVGVGGSAVVLAALGYITQYG